MADTFLEVAKDEQFQGMVSARDAHRSQQFAESMTHFLKLVNNRTLSNHRFGAAMEEAATTSDFPILLGTMLDQQIINAYKAIDNDYRDYVKIGSQQDFRKSQLIGIYGLEKPLPQVAQAGEYKYDTMNEAAIYNQLFKYGKAFGLTWEDIINDRLNAFSDSAAKLSRAATKTEYRNATKLFAGGPVGNPTLFAPVGGTIPQSFDKGAVANTDSLPLTAANLATAIGQMRRQVDIYGEPIFFEKVHLVVPSSLEFVMWQILNPAGLIVSGGDSTAGAKPTVQTSANVLKNYNIVPHVNPYLPILDTATGNKSWYLFIDPADAAAIHFNFLRGHETPEVFMKTGNVSSASGGTVGAMPGSFENDRIDWKVRHVMGGVAVDQRAVSGHIVAN